MIATQIPQDEIIFMIQYYELILIPPVYPEFKIESQAAGQENHDMHLNKMICRTNFNVNLEPFSNFIFKIKLWIHDAVVKFIFINM